MHTLRSVTKLAFASIASTMLLLSLVPATAFALSGSGFQAGDIIDNSIFTNSSAMSVQTIQNFLNAKQPNCDTNGALSNSYWYDASTGYAGSARETDANGSLTNKDSWVTTTRAIYGQRYDSFYKTSIAATPYVCLKDYAENPTTNQNNLQNPSASITGSESAAQIIYNAAQQYQINPEVLIVTLQKEQGLVTDDWPWASEYQEAMGYSCPDTPQGCSSSYAGFYKQVSSAAWQFQYYLTHPNAYNYWLGQSYIQYSPSQSCGGSTVNILNAATAALYIYTPYQPDQAALNNLYGSGDSCSSYGNRNFWRYFNDWFGSSTIPNDPLEQPTLQHRIKTVIYNNTLYTFYYDAYQQVLQLTTVDLSSGTKTTNVFDGSSTLGMGRIDADVGSSVDAVVWQGSLQVFYYDKTNGNLRHAWTNNGNGWSFENLDGDPGSNAHYDADVGINPAVTVSGNQIQLFYYDRTYGHLRHAWTDATGWHFENLDGDAGSVAHFTANVGLTSSVMDNNGFLQLFYYDRDDGTLRHAWTDATGWHFETFDGTFASNSHFWSNVGLDPAVTNLDGSIQLFYYDQSNRDLRHAWTDATGWHFETFDGNLHSNAHYASDVGLNPAVTIYNNQLQLFYYDHGNNHLRHAWTDATGWHFENLDGDSGSLGGETADLGLNSSIISLGDANSTIEVFYTDRTSGALKRSTATTTTSWSFENYATTVIY